MTITPIPRSCVWLSSAASALTIAIVVVAMATTALAAPPASADAGSDGEPTFLQQNSAFVIEPEFVLLTFRATDTAFAIERNPVPSQVGGTVQRLEPGSEAGFRLGLGYRFDDGWDVTVRYTTVEADELTMAAGPDNIIPLLTHPGDLTDAAGATAMMEQQYDSVVIEIGRTFGDATGQRARVFAGPGSVTFDQAVAVDYDVFGDSWTVNARNDVEALGIRFGGEGHLAFGNGASVFGRAALGVYMASFDVALLEVDQATPAQTIVDVTEDLDGSSMSLEAALGFSWNRSFDTWGFGLQLGYEVSNYSDFVNTRDFVDDVNSGKSVTRDDDLGLSGAFLRFTFAF